MALQAIYVNESKMKMRKKALNFLSKYVFIDPIKTSLFLFFACLIVIILLTIFTTKTGYTSDFYQNVLVEAHGMLFDILILGVLLFWMNTFSEKNREIQKLQDELTFYCEYNQPEATFHVSKIIRQLNNLGIYKFNLVRIFLEEASMLGIFFEETAFIGNWLDKAFFNSGNFTECKFITCECRRTDFTEAELNLCSFIDSKLVFTDFTEAKLYKTEFSKSILSSTFFTNAELSYCNFSNSKLDSVNFEGTNLYKCDLTQYEFMDDINFKNATLQECKLLKKDIDKFKAANLIDNEIL
jgi:BTB/POZ domain-containing protein KCTD9